MTTIAVNGALGRMGSRILELAVAQPQDFTVAGVFDQGADKISAASLKGKGVIIDFSVPAGTLAALVEAEKAGWGIVVGTTGLDENTQKALERAAVKIPVVVSANMSIGVNVMLDLVDAASRKLSSDFDIEITEAHHRHKKDAPSGTALMLANAVAKAKNWSLKNVLRFRKDGKEDKERSKEEIGMQVIRAGEIVGDHTVMFVGPSETIEITHRAQSRDTFVRGALAAARFAASAKPGRIYSMADVLKG